MCLSPVIAHVYDVGRLSILIVRGDDGELRAFQNVCRHRGMQLCTENQRGLTELRCVFHRWSWNLAGQLREVPSRKGFGALRNDDFPCLAPKSTLGSDGVRQPDPDAESLGDFLAPVPADIAWADLEDFRCKALISIPVPSNWKTIIDGFSETYHVQGIHPEMLRMVDDVQQSPDDLGTSRKARSALWLGQSSSARRRNRPGGLGGVCRGDGRTCWFERASRCGRLP